MTAQTIMNKTSSRSHAILILRIENSIKVNIKTKVTNIKETTDRIITSSFLYLVDLAGSERVKKTGATEMRLEEAKKINVSLLALGNVISALSDTKSSHISYRDSKLTRLLQESLGGNAKTSLIVTISPSNYNCDETISSLNFGSRAMKVTNKPQVKSKELDLSLTTEKPFNSSNNLTIFNFQNSNSNNLPAVRALKEKKGQEIKNQKNINEPILGGPIISLLKREVENYKSRK